MVLGPAAAGRAQDSAVPYQAAPSTATSNPVQRAFGTVTGTAKEAGEQVVSGAKALSHSLRRLAIEVGSGVDTGKEILDPFVPKGIDRLFTWDLRLVLRNEGIALRGEYLNPPYFRKLSLDYRNRFDPYNKVGIGVTRDDTYKDLGLSVPRPSKGWGIGFAGVKNDYWGMGVDFDKILDRAGADRTLDRIIALSGGYTPLGQNEGRRWNYTWTAGVNHEDLDTTTKGVEDSQHGYGFDLGPVFQHGLDHVTFPGASVLRLEDRFKLDRFKLRLIYSDSQIHPAAWTLGGDVTAYAYKRVRLSFGAQESFLPGPDKARFETKFGISILINFLDFKF